MSEPKKKAKYAPPPVCSRDVDRRFCGVVRGFRGLIPVTGATFSTCFHLQKQSQLLLFANRNT